MDPDQASRQGTAARVAFATFGESGQALDYLNNYHADLDGRPIDLAIESLAGLACVEQHLAGMQAGVKPTALVAAQLTPASAL